VPFDKWKSEVESVRLCLFDGTIDKLGAGVARRMEAERAGVGWHAATAAIAIPAAAQANKQV
jgi:hypothetical protein